MTPAQNTALRIAGAPALLCFQGSPETAARRGTVLCYHGFGGTKERLASYLSALAQAGLLAVSVDAVGTASVATRTSRPGFQSEQPAAVVGSRVDP